MGASVTGMVGAGTGAAVDGRGVGAGVANTSTHVCVGHVSNSASWAS